ncbi:MAG: ATP synthase F1 subunit delta [Actinomycetota bacterium]
MADRIEGYADAMFSVAEAEGAMGAVEEELFRFSRALQGSDELRSALTDQRIPAARRQQIVEDLLGDRANPLTSALVSFVVGAGRARDLPAIIDRLVARAATERDREVAEVRSAVPLDDAQRQRLAEALGNATGKQLEVRVIVDESILGGIVAQIGDTVIDGSVRRRLEHLRSRL